MLSEDQYMERSMDLVAKTRAMREAAEKEMNRFTRVGDYEVRHGFGHKPKEVPIPESASRTSPVPGRSKKAAAKPRISQTSIVFGSVSAERGDGGEDA
jgi:hypothetical protein